jgi:hypothetical protein
MPDSANELIEQLDEIKFDFLRGPVLSNIPTYSTTVPPKALLSRLEVLTRELSEVW